MKFILQLAALLGLMQIAQAGVLVTDLRGKAETDGKKLLSVLSEIADGGMIELAAGAQLVATDLASGREYTLVGAGQFRVSKSGVEGVSGAQVSAKALPAANLPAARVAVARVAQGTLVMRSAAFNSAAPSPLLPARTAVLTVTPILSWSAVEGATSYRVSLFDQGGNSMYSVSTTQNKVALLPAAGLAGGKQYSWRVEALNSQGRIADASTIFSVVAPESAALLMQLKPEVDAPFSRRALYAAQLQEAGAVEEARMVWQALAKERPEDPVLARLAR